MKISRVGYTRCPGCLSHVKVTSATACPFCGDELRAAETIGDATMELLRGSRTALLALGLAGGISFAIACGDGEPKSPAPNNQGNTIDPSFTPDYGTFDPEPNQDWGPTDAGADASDLTDAGSADASSTDAETDGDDAGNDDGGAPDDGL